jgi:hypothetical protein
MDRPLRVFGECDPNNVWYEQWDNGTVFKGGNLFNLLQFKSKFPSGIEIVTQVSKSSKMHPAVSGKKMDHSVGGLSLYLPTYLGSNCF